MKYAAIVLFVAVLAGCGGHGGGSAVLERVVEGPALLDVHALGELQSSKSTPLNVPGQGWSPRQLQWMLPDGSLVKKDEVVARFSADNSQLQLSDALIDLQRNELARVAKSVQLGATQGQLQVDLSQVDGQLAIARRYANASQDALARNTILDAVQDEHFLGVKQDTLNWREGTASKRGSAELALIDAQKSTNSLVAKQRRADLDALELRAPHAGVFVLHTDWSGNKPSIGATMWAGTQLADLPDTQHMEVLLTLAQTQAQSIKTGLVVELAPLGAPTQKIASTISWVAAAAAVRDRQSPVKYLSMKALVPADAVARYQWTPGQSFVADIILLKSGKTIAIPNIAIHSSDANSSVKVRVGNHDETRELQLGVRGPARSQVLKGLQPGDAIVINAAEPAATKVASKPTPPLAKPGKAES
ncbi:MAG: hypothetical protein ABI304_07870 [Rudaea sp.]